MLRFSLDFKEVLTTSLLPDLQLLLSRYCCCLIHDSIKEMSLESIISDSCCTLVIHEEK